RRDRATAGRRSGQGEPHRPRGPVSQPALRRPAAARGAGARARAEPRHPAARRAAVESGREDPRAGARRDPCAAEGARHHDDLRHARSGGGVVALGSRGRDARRTRAAGGVAQGALRAAGEPLRGRLRRHQQLHPRRRHRARRRPRAGGDGPRSRVRAPRRGAGAGRRLRARRAPGERGAGRRRRERRRGAGAPGRLSRQHAALRHRDGDRSRAQGGRRRPVAPRGAARGPAGARGVSRVGHARAARRVKRDRALPALGIALIWAFLAVFLVYPLLRVFYDAFSDEAGRLTLENFAAFGADAFYRRSLWNSLLLGAGTVAATSVLGFAVALLLVRYDFPGRGLFGYLTLIPIISPPLVGALGFVFLVAARRYVAIKDYSSLSYSRLPRRRLGPLGGTAAVTFLSAVLAFSFVPYLGVALASVGKGWSMTPFPVRYTGLFFER